MEVTSKVLSWEYRGHGHVLITFLSVVDIVSGTLLQIYFQVLRSSSSLLHLHNILCVRMYMEEKLRSLW